MDSIDTATQNTSWTRASRFLLRGLPVVLAMLAGGLPALAQDKKETSDGEKPFSIIQEGTRPLLTITFSNVDRFLEKAKYVFDAADAPDAYKKVEGLLKTQLNDLDGFNRKKPFGVMAYLPAAFPPIPEFIAFVPVDSVEAATKLVEKAPVVIGKGDEEGRYEIIAPNRSYPMMLRDGYAFLPLGNDPPEEALDRDLPNPAQLVAGLSQQFDVSVCLDIESIPAATRSLLMSVLSSGISTQLQQRDNEPDGAYKIRRVEGQRGLAALTQVVTECQKMTFGIAVEPDEKAINFDLVIDALEGTKLLKEMFQSVDRPSYFIPLLDDSAAVSLSMSSRIAERDQLAYIEMVDGFREEIARLIDLYKLGPVPDENSPINGALSAVQKTLEDAHMDVFAQFYRDSSGKLAIVGAMRVEDGDAIGAGLTDALARLKDIPEVQKAGELNIGSGEHQGITFHRLVFAAQDPGAVEVFGKNVGLMIGVGARSGWAVLGGDDSFATLQSVMDKLEESYSSPQEFQTPPNFRVIVNVNQLIDMAELGDAASKKSREAKELELAQKATDVAVTPAPEGVAEKPVVAAPSSDPTRDARRARRQARRDRGGEILRETLAEGDDRIEMDSRLTETGARMRVRLEEGFVKAFGKLIANGMNDNQQEPVPPEGVEATEAVPAAE